MLTDNAEAIAVSITFTFCSFVLCSSCDTLFVVMSFAAFIYAFAVFGPLLGFALGALMLQYYVDLLSFDTVLLKLNTSNPRWVGAWWAGFIFIGGLLFLVSLPFFGFPRLLVRELRELVREDPARLDAMIVEHSGGHCHRSSGALSSSQSTSAAYGKSLRGNQIQFVVFGTIHMCCPM